MEDVNDELYRIGVDEVGRGPVAGPVVVCACAKQEGVQVLHLFPDGMLRDSKKVTKKKREAIVEALKEYQEDARILFGIGEIPASYIDEFGIRDAIREATRVALRGLLKEGVNLATLIYLDGSLDLDEGYMYETIIKGDEKVEEIALASIYAKVYRDRLMEIEGEKYPEYGFHSHAGYGTRAHYSALRVHGTTPLHRKSFLTKMK